MEGKARKRRNWKCPGEARLEPSCPSLAVNPVFDPAEDSKDASASRSRPSVSGTRQSPPHSPCVAASRGHAGTWLRADGAWGPWGWVTVRWGGGLGRMKDCRPAVAL